MTVAYFDESSARIEPRVAVASAKSTARGFWARALDRLIAARELQARREIDRYHYVLEQRLPLEG